MDEQFIADYLQRLTEQDGYPCYLGHMNCSLVEGGLCSDRMQSALLQEEVKE